MQSQKHSVVVDMTRLFGLLNIHYLVAPGSGPQHWHHVRVGSMRSHLQWSEQLGTVDVSPGKRFSGNDFGAIVFDVANCLQQERSRYTGFHYETKANLTVLSASQGFCMELFHISQVVHGYSNCAESFYIVRILSIERRVLASMARSYGATPVSLATSWDDSGPFRFNINHEVRAVNKLHHTDYSKQWPRQLCLDRIMQRSARLARGAPYGFGNTCLCPPPMDSEGP